MNTTPRVYLDHAAATPVHPEVLAAMQPYWSNLFGNPGAIHQEGVIAKRALESARAATAALLNVLPDEIYFTAGATESANLAIQGSVYQVRADGKIKDPNIVVSAIEHAAVLACAKDLASKGIVELRIVPVNQDGVVDLVALKKLIDRATVLVSVMYVNNEIGTIQPVQEIARILRERRKELHGTRKEQVAYPYFHTDACQAVNYFPLRIPALGVDLLTLNAAKIYGPKGIALLYKKRRVALSPALHGGGQEGGMRPGTENVPLVMGLHSALELVQADCLPEGERLRVLRDSLLSGIQELYPDIIINGSLHDRSPNNLNVSFPKYDHEHMVLALDAKGVAVSTKSACNELDAEISHVLLALRGSDSTLPLNGIRMTLGRGTTAEDIARVIAAFRDIRKQLLSLV